MHRVISRRHTAVGQLADFQGANDEDIGSEEQRSKNGAKASSFSERMV